MSSSSSSNTHQPFPSAPIDPSKIKLTTSKHVWDLILSCYDINSIRSTLVPALSNLAEGKGQPGNKPKDKIAAGEHLLMLEELDLKGFGSADLTIRTAGLIYVATVRLKKARAPQAQDCLNFAANLCTLADPEQLKACAPQVTKFALEYISLAHHVKTPEEVIEPLYRLICTGGTRGLFWGVFAAFLEGSLLARRFDFAMNLINDTFTNFGSYSPTYMDVLTYYHHAGYICSIMGNYGKAKEMYLVAVSAPTSAASAIQLSCAKRAILCGLIDDGKLVSWPKYTSSATSRVLERNTKEYVKLGKAFAQADWKTVLEVSKNKEFETDFNQGLLEEVIDSIPKRRILRLREIYSRLTVEALALKLEMDTQELLVILGDLISTGELRATLSSDTSPIITFDDTSIDYTAPGMMAELASVNATAIALEKDLSAGSKYLGIHEDYLKKQVEVLNGGTGGGGGKGGSGGNGKGEALGPAFGMRGVGSNYADIGF